MMNTLRLGDPPGGRNTVLAKPRAFVVVPAPLAEVKVVRLCPQYAL